MCHLPNTPKNERSLSASVANRLATVASHRKNGYLRVPVMPWQLPVTDIQCKRVLQEVHDVLLSYICTLYNCHSRHLAINTYLWCNVHNRMHGHPTTRCQNLMRDFSINSTSDMPFSIRSVNLLSQDRSLYTNLRNGGGTRHSQGNPTGVQCC